MTTAYKRTEDLDISVVSDGYVVYDLAHEQVYYLNPSSAFILELCDGRATIASIADELKAAFDLAAAPVEDVTTCVAQFAADGLVFPVPVSD